MAQATNFMGMYDNFGKQVAGATKTAAKATKEIDFLYQQMKDKNYKQKAIDQFVSKNPEASKYISRLRNIKDAEDLNITIAEYIAKKEKANQFKRDNPNVPFRGYYPDKSETLSKYDGSLFEDKAAWDKKQAAQKQQKNIGAALQESGGREDFFGKLDPEVAGSKEAIGASKTFGQAKPVAPPIPRADALEISQATTPNAAMQIAIEKGHGNKQELKTILSTIKKNKDQTEDRLLKLKETKLRQDITKGAQAIATHPKEQKRKAVVTINSVKNLNRQLERDRDIIEQKIKEKQTTTMLDENTGEPIVVDVTGLKQKLEDIKLEIEANNENMKEVAKLYGVTASDIRGGRGVQTGEASDIETGERIIIPEGPRSANKPQQINLPQNSSGLGQKKAKASQFWN